MWFAMGRGGLQKPHLNLKASSKTFDLSFSFTFVQKTETGVMLHVNELFHKINTHTSKDKNLNVHLFHGANDGQNAAGPFLNTNSKYCFDKV